VDIKLVQQLREMPWIDTGSTVVDLETEKHPGKEKLLNRIKDVFNSTVDKADVFTQLLSFLLVLQKEGITRQDLLDAIG
jgi:hypothetical protein